VVVGALGHGNANVIIMLEEEKTFRSTYSIFL
jgi:hypothetical protein